MVAEREGGKREGGRGIHLIFMDNDITQVKVGGEPSGFWEYGGHCLGNRSVGPAYVIPQVLEALIPTPPLSQFSVLSWR